MSRTSGSCSTRPPQAGHDSIVALMLACTPSHSWQYQMGIRCPHQSCREIVQSWMFSSQLSYTPLKRSGTNASSPLRAASSAGSARGAICTNHCLLINGWITVSHRSQCPTLWVCDSTETSHPSASALATTPALASSIVIPSNSPACSLSVASRLRMFNAGRPVRWAMSKSFGSCAGVTLTAPVPNARSTWESATTGISRLLIGNRTCLPIKR